MAAISRSQLQRELIPGLNALFGLSYNEYPLEFPEIYTEYSSDRSFEEDTKLTGFGTAPIKQEGAATLFDTAQEGYATRYIMDTYSLGFALTQEAFEDNLYDSLATRYTKELARSMRNTKEIKAAAVLNNGFTTYGVGDGVSLYSTAHPQIGAAAIANRPTVAADLNETSLEAAVTAISRYTDDRGKLINVRVKKLIVPPELMWTATRLLETSLRVGTADNDINALKTNSAVPQGYATNHFLTDSDAWFLTTDVPEGFKYFNRVPESQDEDPDFDTGNFRYKVRARYSFGVSDYLATYGSPGA